MTTFLLTALVIALVFAAAFWAHGDGIRIPDRGRFPRTTRLWN
jgi:hypothetical protein